MQTFLPYSDFKKTAQCLDNRRLGKQRVEAYQILRVLTGQTKGWQNHPALKMWQGYETALVFYTFAICSEWLHRGYKDTVLEKTLQLAIQHVSYDYRLPPFIHKRTFLNSHRSNLVRKSPEHYRKFFPKIPDNLPYYWPTKN